MWSLSPVSESINISQGLPVWTLPLWISPFEPYSLPWLQLQPLTRSLLLRSPYYFWPFSLSPFFNSSKEREREIFNSVRNPRKLYIRIHSPTQQVIIFTIQQNQFTPSNRKKLNWNFWLFYTHLHELLINLWLQI